MNRVRLIALAFVFGSLSFACGDPAAIKLAKEWHDLGDTGKEELCKNLSKQTPELMAALKSWLEQKKAPLGAKSTELAAEIAKLDKKGFDKLKETVDKWSANTGEPCDKLKAGFSTTEQDSYNEVSKGIADATKPARDAYEAKAKELNIPLSPKDIEHFEP